MTIVNWELDHCQPLTRSIPKIIDFLDYAPQDLFPVGTVGQKIRRYRLLEGMTRKELAEHLNLDESTLFLLEADRGKNFQKTMRKLSPFIVPL